jgi:hypothetical protein
VVPLLPRLTDLEELGLNNPAVTDAEVRALSGLPKLQSLGVMGAPISDDALAVMKTLPALRILNISLTKVTDAGLEHVQGLTALEYLGLKGNAISDAGLSRLKSLTNLTSLNLADTKVTDAGLVHLAGMTHLEVGEPLERRHHRCRSRAARQHAEPGRHQPHGDQGHGRRPCAPEAASQVDQAQRERDRGDGRGCEGSEEIPAVLGDGDSVAARAL